MGFGPCSSWARLELLTLPGRRHYVCFDAEEEPLTVIARLEPLCAESASAFFTDLLARNGESYGVGMFGGMPSNIHNSRPDLVPRLVVRAALGKWMRWSARRDPSVWAELRDSLIGPSEEPDHLDYSSRLIAAFPALNTPAGRAQFERGKRAARAEGAALSPADKNRILDNYLAVSYFEPRTDP